jgi:plasmid stability protein
MGQILIRKLEDAILVELKRQASDQGISLEEKARRILAEAAKRRSKEQLLAEMDRIAKMGKPITKPPYSQDMIREDRNGGEDGRYRR